MKCFIIISHRNGGKWSGLVENKSEKAAVLKNPMKKAAGKPLESRWKAAGKPLGWLLTRRFPQIVGQSGAD